MQRLWSWVQKAESQVSEDYSPALKSNGSCCERGLLFIAVQGLFTAVASLVAEHSL